MKKFGLLFLGLSSCCFLGAQYTPLEDDPALKQKYLDACAVKFKKDKLGISGPYKKDITAMYAMRYDLNKARCDNGSYVFDKSSQMCFNQIINQIADKNPGYDFSEIKPVLNRNSQPNAFSVGEGTVAINTGLLRLIDKHGYLVYVMCHEMAHYLLDHSNHKIHQLFDEKQSEARKKQIQKILNNQYNQVSRLKELVKAELYSERENSRNHEYDADSLGLLLFVNAGYDPKLAYETMDFLDKLNTHKEAGEVDIFQILGTPVVQPESATLLAGYKEEGDLEDELMITHPYCKDRKEYLQWLMQKRNAVPGTTTVPAYCEELQKFMDYEYALSLKKSRQLDRALLYALGKMNSDPENPFYRDFASECMYGLFDARKNHKIQMHASAPNEVTDSSHIKLANYIYASRMTVFTRNTLAFCQKNLSNPYAEESLYMLAMLARAASDSEAFGTYKNTYLEKYPTGKYYKQLKSIQ